MSRAEATSGLQSSITARRWWHVAVDASLRVKLIIAFLVVTTLSVLAVSVMTYRATRVSLTSNVATSLQNTAAAQAFTVGDLLSRELDLLNAFALNKLMQDEAAAANQRYQGDAAAIQKQISALDQQWLGASDDDPLIQSVQTNTIASELIEFRSEFPENVEIQVTDRYGALVAATNRTSDYLQADESWWKATYRDGQGAVFIGQPDYDQSSKTMSIVFAVPLREHGGEAITGVLRTTYQLKALSDLLAMVHVGQTGGTDLLLSSGHVVQSNGDVAPLDSTTLTQLQQTGTQHYTALQYDGTHQLVTQASITSHDAELNAVIADLGWTMIVHQPSAEALSPLNVAWNTTVYTGALSLVLATMLAVAVAYVVSQPLGRLTHAAQQVAAGNLGYRVHVQQRGEIGLLASGFNHMADSLQERITAEQAAQAEAKRLQQVEAEQRQRLEQTVATYLQFVQKVATGNLTERLPVQEEGTLGELGHGLNHMIESLHDITRDVQQANAAIAVVAAEILAATTQQAGSTAEQSAALTQTVTTIAEVKAIAQQTTQQATEVAQESQSILNMAREGTRSVEKTVIGMEQIKQRVESIAETILALVEQTQMIGSIITTVSELADQSNLLALNAAIEAARAGEQGKSFVVVAQHVRELAERSKSATVQVREILGEIQHATNAAVLVTEEGTKGVESGGKLAAQAGQTIYRMASEVEQGAQTNVQMAAAAQQQMAGMEQIGQAMTSIQQATSQTLASTRQAERAAQNLRTLAQSLQSAIATYRL